MNKMIPFYYHLFCSVFLIYLSFFSCLNWFIRSFLFYIGLIHLYDCWWFYKYDKDAPI